MDAMQLNELLECPVCLKQLDQGCKVLPCQHTFCRRCLREIVESRKELRCPECRILVDKDVDDLPANIFLVRFLEGLNFGRQREHSSDSLDAEMTEKSGNQEPIPSARALYDYEPKEAGDLTLHKGEIITLLKKVDENWYEGLCNGCQGFLPANYIEVIQPLPSLDDSFDRPIAKALFDFEDEQEQDLLSFKQGDIISVIRQVDENWCEGKLNNKFGIFPITFVELNVAARSLMEGGEHVEDQTQAIAKPPRQSLSPDANKGEPKRHTMHFVGQRNEESRPAGLQRRSLDVSSSERLADALDSSTSPGSGTFQNRQNTPSPRSSVHSLSNQSVGESNNTRRGSSPSSNSHSQSASARKSSHESNRGGSRPVSAEMGKELYVALYSYKPTKEDELELVRNENYCVTEKCKDGWFKGYSVSTQRRGVFPGNYVRLASIHNLLTRSRSDSVEQDKVLNAGTQNSSQPQPPPHQRPPPPRQRASEGVSQPRFCRSDSAPAYPQQAVVPVGGLVVNLNQRRNLVENANAAERPAERSRFVPTSPLPPPPAPKSSSFWKKLTGKKKDRTRATPPPPPPPPYQRSVPAGHSALSPPPYDFSSLAPSVSQAHVEGTSQVHHRVENPAISERYRVVVAYPPQHEAELELRVGDIVFVTKKRQDGWYKGTLERNGKTGIFPGSFVDIF